LQYVYTGNVHNQEGDTTFCANCHSALIVRDWYQINQYRLTKDAKCPDCGASVPGYFASHAGTFGRKRIPLAMNIV